MSDQGNTDHIWQRAEIESPCIPEARKAVMDDLPERTKLITKRRGGRAARLKR